MVICIIEGIAQWIEHCTTNAGFVGVRVPLPSLWSNFFKKMCAIFNYSTPLDILKNFDIIFI